MIYISDAAQAHFAKLLKNQKKGTQIRIFVVNPGTLKAECGVSYCLKEEIESNDVVLNFDQFTVYIDEISNIYLKDAEIDMVTDQLGSQIILRAPNAKIPKVPDNAPLIKRVEYLIQSQINPQLANHGGYISLIEINDKGYAIVRFGGSCNGCAMLNVTLKESIEKQLLREFPELQGVCEFSKYQ